MSLVPDPEVLLLLGPAVLFFMTFAETAVPAGFLVPAGVAVALGSFMAHQGFLPWDGVLIASALGGLAGDSTGYWLGRRGAGPFRSLPGRLGRLLRLWERSSRRLFQGPTAFAVTIPRMASFVRTLMPTSAGMSGITYPRFLVYDVAGVALWLTLYVAVGVLAGESWQMASGIIGGGWALIICLIGVIAWFVAWRRRRRRIVERVVRSAIAVKEPSPTTSGEDLSEAEGRKEP